MSPLILIYDFDDVGMGRVCEFLASKTRCKALLLRDPSKPIEVRHDGARLILRQGETHLTDVDFQHANRVVFRRWRMQEDPFVSVPDLSEDDRVFAEREWSSLIFGIFLQQERRNGGIWINPPSSYHVHRNKHALMCHARNVGLDVPSFIATTRVESPVQNGGSVVVKAISTDQQIDTERYFFTTPLSADFLEAQIGTSLPCPTLFQEHVPHEKEWRVYHLLGECLAFEITTRSSVADIRMESPADLTINLIELPAVLTSALGTFCRELDLQYCAFDFLVAGAQVRLIDASPAGSWDYIDNRTDNHVSQWIAERV